MPQFPNRTELVDDYPRPDVAVFKAGLGKLWDAITGLLGTSGSAVDARGALGAAAAGANSDITSLSGARVNHKRATVASAATTAAIWSVAGNQIDWTGTVTCTGFPDAPQAGASCTLICAAAASFTAGANMLIDGTASGSTITLEANDIVVVEAITTTQFRLRITKYDGSSVDEAAEVVLASAATVNIGAAKSRNIQITGTTAITAFDNVRAGIVRKIRFAGVLTLNNGSNISLPGAANITTAAGDCAEAVSLGAGSWVVRFYQRANGQAVAGGSGVTSVNGNAGPITAAQISSAATAGYGYTPVSPVGNNFPAFPVGNFIGAILIGTNITDTIAVCGSTYSGSGTSIGSVNVRTTVSGTWKCLVGRGDTFGAPLTGYNNTPDPYYLYAFQRIA